MTPEQQRIAIADACGWKWVGMRGSKNHGYFYLNITARQIPIAVKGKLKGATSIYDLPDYLNDLNAMHGAEETLLVNGDMPPEWYNQIVSICGNRNGYAMRAKAEQRAEAFLRTINKWKD